MDNMWPLLGEERGLRGINGNGKNTIKIRGGGTTGEKRGRDIKEHV